MQQWEANLTDDDGDGVWEGTQWRHETTGRPLLKVVAKDGEGERANIDFMSRNLVVEAPADDMRGLLLAGGALGLVSLVGLVTFVVARRRRAWRKSICSRPGTPSRRLLGTGDRPKGRACPRRRHHGRYG